MTGGRPGPGELARRLGELEVEVEAAFGAALGVWALDYPGGRRPSSALSLSGRGQVAAGELVAFDDGEQAAFAGGPWRALAGARGRVEELLPAADGLDEAGRWRRAAIEGALLDLALRQAGRSLAAMAELREAIVRTVTSFSACPDPASVVTSLGRGLRFKVDVDPTWSEAAVGALAGTDAVAVLDFKGRGEPALAGRLAARLPGALLEDPPAGAALPAGRVVLDLPLVTVADVVAAREAGHGVNIKAPRMGGFLTALEALEAARRGAGPVYAGGMFEVGVGRRRARALAAIGCPVGPNDLAPIRGVERPPPGARDPGALLVRLDRPGLGG